MKLNLLETLFYVFHITLKSVDIFSQIVKIPFECSDTLTERKKCHDAKGKKNNNKLLKKRAVVGKFQEKRVYQPEESNPNSKNKKDINKLSSHFNNRLPFWQIVMHHMLTRETCRCTKSTKQAQ